MKTEEQRSEEGKFEEKCCDTACCEGEGFAEKTGQCCASAQVPVKALIAALRWANV